MATSLPWPLFVPADSSYIHSYFILTSMQQPPDLHNGNGQQNVSATCAQRPVNQQLTNSVYRTQLQLYCKRS